MQVNTCSTSRKAKTDLDPNSANVNDFIYDIC